MELTAKTIRALLHIGGISSDAVVTKTASKRKKVKSGDPIELTRFSLAPGSWLICGQASFKYTASGDTQMEYQLSLQYSSGNKPIDGQHSYMRLSALEFGSPIVIDAVKFDSFATVRLMYSTQGNRSPWATSRSIEFGHTDERAQILTAIKIGDLLIL
jgi:hypothetical protein